MNIRCCSESHQSATDSAAEIREEGKESSSTHRMKITTPGADIKRFPRMMEASLISVESRTDGWTDGRTDGWMDGQRCRVYDPQGGALGKKLRGEKRNFFKK